jgi:hypothetical protein
VDVEIFQECAMTLDNTLSRLMIEQPGPIFKKAPVVGFAACREHKEEQECQKTSREPCSS